MPHISIVVVDVFWEFRISKRYSISTEVASGSLIPSDMSKKKTDSAKSRWLLLYAVSFKICF